MQSLKYYSLHCLFPLFFMLHGVNENFGLISFTTILFLYLKYSLVSLGVGFISTKLFRSKQKALVFSFFVLCFYFFFGAIKELLQNTWFDRYSILLPALLVIVILLYLFIRSWKSGDYKFSKFITYFLLIITLSDLGILIFNIASKKAVEQDFGDRKNSLVDSVLAAFNKSERPDIFWLVIDEYSSARVLKNHFNTINPLIGSLEKKGFFIADSAYSNYNYTHFSLASQLDMVYLNELVNHSIVTPKDAMRGNLSLFKNNTCELLKRMGYKIDNLSIYDVEGAKSRGMTPFEYTPRSLIDNQTLSGKISRDLGWQIPILFRSDKRKAKLELNRKFAFELDKKYVEYHQQLHNRIRTVAADPDPVFLMAHLFDAHEPFIYNADGTVYAEEGLNAKGNNRYVAQLLHSNTIIEKLIESIQTQSKKDYIIILQGDHGFKFAENDTLFEKESGSTLFAVYYTKGNYESWPRHLTTVNAFRILFNDRFQANLPLLPNRTFNLLYRSKGAD